MTETINHRPVLIEKSGRFFFHIEELGLIGSGDTLADAYADLQKRYGDLLEQARAADILDELPGPARDKARATDAGTVRVASDIKGFLIRCLIVCLLAGVLVVPVALLVGNSIDRAFARLQPKGRGPVLVQIEEGLHKMADPKNDIAPERKQQIVADLRTLITRIKPFTDELRPLSGGGPDDACRTQQAR